MKTNSIPVILMLIAGALACILGFVYHYETTHFFTMVLAVLIIFYVLGSIVKIIIDTNFSEKPKKKKGNSEDVEETKENINSEGEEKADE